jgi:uncharacterized repeat protein (TIGR03803 family)
MHRDARSLVVNRALAVACVSMIFVGSAWAVNVSGKVLHSFSGNDGATPTGHLAIDAHGNVFGTTSNGGVGSGCGSSACGVVYELSPSGNGTTETILWTFTNGADGGGPQGGVILDGAGNLYGTTLYGGSGDGCGTVFQLTPNLNGGWTKNVLHNFNSLAGNDGCFPYSGLTFDAAGNLYGTTASGGTDLTGAIFELSPNLDGSWDYSVIYNFQEGGSGDGSNPHGTLVFDSAGNMYGTTLNGGPSNAGAVFQLVPSNGGWTESVIYVFDGPHGAGPYSGVILDVKGDLFGMTSAGGADGLGLVYELTPSGGGWIYTLIHTFNGPSGAFPGPGSLLMDASGNLYGETLYGGHQFGVVFELVPQQGGGWTDIVLHAFLNKADGSNPSGGISMDAAGNLYGTCEHGGAGGFGIAFEGKVN